MLNKHICEAVDLVESYQWAIGDLEEAITWAEKETDNNKNARKDNTTNQDFLAYCQGDLKYQKNKLERAKVRLDICVRTFNKGGWTF